jgi:hypothetical protein
MIPRRVSLGRKDGIGRLRLKAHPVMEPNRKGYLTGLIGGGLVALVFFRFSST